MARKRARGEAPWIFRILLLPMLYGYLRLLSFLDYPSLDFVFQLPNAPFLTYGRNYLLLAACLLGFLLILFAAPGRRLPLGAGLLLLTCPVWMRAFLQFHAVQGGARAALHGVELKKRAHPHRTGEQQKPGAQRQPPARRGEQNQQKAQQARGQQQVVAPIGQKRRVRQLEHEVQRRIVQKRQKPQIPIQHGQKKDSENPRRFAPRPLSCHIHPSDGSLSIQTRLARRFLRT